MSKYNFLYKHNKIFALLSMLLLCFCIVFSGCGSCRDKEFQDTSAKDFQTYTEQLFLRQICSSTITLHYTLAHPEKAGISSYPISLGHISLPENSTASAEAENILFALDHFSKNSLSLDQQVDYEIIQDYLQTQIAEDTFPYYPEILSPAGGIQSELPILLAEYPFYDEQDIIDYLNLLTLVPDYFNEVIQYETQKSRAGLFMSDYASEVIIAQCQAMTADPDTHFLIETFKNRLKNLSLSSEKIQKYEKQNSRILTQQVFPAFQQLSSAILELQGSGKNQGGLCNYEHGKDYYSYLVYASTGSDKSVEDFQKAVSRQREKDLENLQILLGKNKTLASDLPNAQISLNTPEEMLLSLSQTAKEDFPKLEKDVKAEIKNVDPSLQEYLAPAFYLTVPIDEVKNNAIYINQKSKTDQITLFTTIAHEGYPGHLFQTVYYNNHEKNLFRHLMNYPGYIEGWATYAELYSYKYTGLPENTAKYLQLEQSIILSLYASADFGIHYDGWTLKDTAQFFGNYGFSDSETIKEIYEYIVETPANYLKYYGGYLEFLELRESAEKKYGDAFDISAFHEALLKIGPAPFSVLEKYLPEYYKAARS